MWLVGFLALVGCAAGCVAGITLNSMITERQYAKHEYRRKILRELKKMNKRAKREGS